MMNYSLFCVPAINNKRKAVLGIYNQDLFYQGFFIPITLNCIITQEYWQNLKQQSKVTNKQLHIIIVSIKQHSKQFYQNQIHINESHDTCKFLSL